MEYKIGEKIYVVSGFYEGIHIPQNERFYIEAKLVLKIGKYITIGLDEKYTFNERLIPSNNTLCDSYSISKDQKKNKNLNNYLVFNDNNITHMVFKTRKSAEQFLYDICPNGFFYTFCDPIDYPKNTSKPNLSKYNL